MKKLFIFAVVGCFFAACGGTESPKNQAGDADASSETVEKEISEYDPHRGEGKFENIQLAALDLEKAKKGEADYDMKCQSCHKLTSERLVGPGWQGVTKRHKPEWILNFITNPSEMIDKDPKLQEQLELCMLRMPNQNLNDESAFQLLEFMRKNDGDK